MDFFASYLVFYLEAEGTVSQRWNHNYELQCEKDFLKGNYQKATRSENR